MDHTNNLDFNKYVMSLDALDLSLLPNFYNSRLKNNSPLLWTAKSSKLNNDYFEFEIKPKADSTISNDDDMSLNNDMDTNDLSDQYQSNPSLPGEEIVTITCHICDIQVPAVYLIDHENSLKHKAHVKVAEVVLDRTRKHMLRKSARAARKNDGMYFCGPCSSEVQVAKKHAHEMSKAHRQSLALDRLLYELVALYTNEESDSLEDLSSAMKSKTLYHKTNGVKQEVDRNIDKHTVVISDMKARLDEFEIKTTENFIRMIDECDADKSYVLTSVGNDIRISMHDNSEVVVSMDNFNGFVRVEENFTLCIVCKQIVENENAHKISDTHIRNIVTPFKDRHCLRNLNISSSHCVICNKIVGNSDLHVLCDETHVELLQKALVLNEKDTNESLQKPSVNNPGERNETDGTVCNGFAEDSDHHNISKETDGNRLLKSITVKEPKTKDEESINNVNITNFDTFEIHNDVYVCRLCNIEMHKNSVHGHLRGIRHTMNSKSNVHYIMKRGVATNNLVCRVCDVYVEDDINQIKEHISTIDHVTKYNGLLLNNFVTRKKEEFYCQLCDVVVPKMHELYHIDKFSHETKLNNIKDEIDRGEEMVENHADNQNTNVNAPVDDDPERSYKIPAYFCDICAVYIPNNPHNINDHNNGARHQKNVSVTKEVSVENSSSVTGYSGVHYEMDATENEKSVMCKLCQVVVPNITNSIKEHITGKKHDMILKAFLNTNHIECGDGQYFCKNCNVHIIAENLYIHTNQKRHKKSLKSLEKKLEIAETAAPLDLQAATTSTENQNGNIFNNNTNKELIDTWYLKFKYHLMETDNEESLQCKICSDTAIPNTVQGVVNHTSKQTHKTGYKQLIYKNIILEIENRGYFCAICICIVPLKGEVHHATGSRHTANYLNATKEQICNLCNTDASTNMAYHITSPGHIDNVMKSQSLLHYCEYCKALVPKDKSDEHNNNCHKFIVKNKLCFCTICDPYLPANRN